MPNTKRLVAVVGTNIGNRRFEPGDVIAADLTDQQRRYLVREGHAAETETGPKIKGAK